MCVVLSLSVKYLYSMSVYHCTSKSTADLVPFLRKEILDGDSEPRKVIENIT